MALTLGPCNVVPAALKTLGDLGVPGFNNYKPAPEIVALADSAKLSEKGRQIFYSAQPEVDADRTTFEQHCHAPVTTTAVELGCYTSLFIF